jgi:hypothetical protein
VVDPRMPYFKATTVCHTEHGVQCSRLIVDSFCNHCSKMLRNKDYRFTERKYSILMDCFNVPLCRFTTSSTEKMNK